MKRITSLIKKIWNAISVRVQATIQRRSDVLLMTKRDFTKLPRRASFRENIGKFDSLVILPTKNKHDNGYLMMDFVAVSGRTPICRVSGCSDILHIDGIGGYGKWNPAILIPDEIKPKGWSIDCLPKSGLLRIYSNKKLICGEAISSFELYGVEAD